MDNTVDLEIKLDGDSNKLGRNMEARHYVNGLQKKGLVHLAIKSHP